MKPGFVFFFWLVNDPETVGKWHLALDKMDFMPFGQTVFPDGGKIQGQIFNHIKDIRKFRSNTIHLGLVRAIDDFFIEAEKRKWTDWLFFTDPPKN